MTPIESKALELYPEPNEDHYSGPIAYSIACNNARKNRDNAIQLANYALELAAEKVEVERINDIDDVDSHDYFRDPESEYVYRPCKQSILELKTL